MAPLTLANGTDIASWSDRIDARAQLPILIRRLIHATVPRDKIQRIGFPAEEGIQLGEYDGVLKVKGTYPWVPKGVSVWEVSANKAIKKKADKDYEKRTKNPLGVTKSKSTFVFVTSRRWGAKEKWHRNHIADGKWKNILVYDADDLAQWLDRAPVVHYWLSRLIGKHHDDAITIDQVWMDWSNVTNPPTNSDLMLAGRDEVVTSVLKWLKDKPSALSLQADTREEAVAVLAACYERAPVEVKIELHSRTIHTTGLTAWRRMIDFDMPLVLVSPFDSIQEVNRAVSKGHHVCIPLGRRDSGPHNTINVSRLSREIVTAILNQWGFEYSKARELASLARRSFKSFQRKLSPNPTTQQPEWARPDQARTLVPALLAGMWSDQKDGDRDIISRLAGQTYGTVISNCIRWSNESDPPLRKIGDAWYLSSKEDAFLLLYRYLFPDDVNIFSELVIETLSTPDPRFDLPLDDQWKARMLSKEPPHSELLREGLADNLAFLGARGNSLKDTDDIALKQHVRAIVWKVLERANNDWKIWATLSPWLPKLAEAAPDEFLDAVEDGSVGDDPPIFRLFVNPRDMIMGIMPHTGLLWALETLAWSPEYLARVTLILAKLPEYLLNERMMNRPLQSLRGIFLPWYPNTTAPIQQRLIVLDKLRNIQQETAWRLMCNILPRTSDSAYNNAKPLWREWAPEFTTPVTDGEYLEAIHEIVDRLLRDVGANAERLQDLIDALGNLPKKDFDLITKRLESMDPNSLASDDRAAIWDKLRKMVLNHRLFPGAHWSLPAEPLERLDRIVEIFEPSEIGRKYCWLFGWEADRTAVERENRDELRAQVEERRREAVNAIYNSEGLDGLLDLVNKVERPMFLGFPLGRSEMVDDDEEDDLLFDNLSSDDEDHIDFIRGFIRGRIQERGRGWAESKFSVVKESWTPIVVAMFMALTPCDGRTWDLIETASREIVSCYWRKIKPYDVEHESQQLVRAVKKLLEHHRPYSAADVLAVQKDSEIEGLSDLIIEVLDQVVNTTSEEDKDDVGSMSDYNIAVLLDVLAKDESITQMQMAKYEWFFYLPLQYQREPKALKHYLGADPEFFVQVVSIVYRADDEEPHEASEAGQTLFRLAHRLLDSWRTIPGTLDSGKVDESLLKEWVTRARSKLQEVGRLEIGDIQIGKVLSGSPQAEDGAWPHEAVRDVIETISSPALKRGFELGVYNSRGVVRKSMDEGGTQEYELAERYKGYAESLRDRWPTTARILKRISTQYEAEGKQADLEVEKRADLN